MNEDQKEVVEQTQEPVQNVETTTEQAVPSTQQEVVNSNPTPEQANIESVETDKLSSQLSQENQNIVAQQGVISKEIDEAKQKEQEEAKKAQEAALSEAKSGGPSTFAKIMTFLLFGALFAFVYFLGDITEYINQKKLEKETAEITNGRLTCNNSKTTDNLDIRIDTTFNFENKGITSLTYVTTSTGDKIKDKEELEKLYNDCKTLKDEVSSYNGVSVICSNNNGVVTVKQSFEYANLNVEEIGPAYSEAGGVYPQFKYKDDINSVESKMIASDYSCEKVRR